VQLRLARPTAALKGDRFIVRRPSPGITIGGGTIVDAHPRRHKRFQPATLDALATLERGTPEELLLQALAAGPLDLKTLGERAHLPAEILRDALAATLADGRATLLSGDPAAPRPADVVAAAAGWAALRARMAEILGAHHAQFPLRRGMSKEEFKSRLGLAPRVADAAAAAALREDAIAEDGATFRLPTHEITFTPAQRALVDRYLAALAAQPYAPPSPAEFGVPTDVLAALAETGAVVRVDESVVFAPAAYDELVAETLRLIDAEGTITLARFRDRFDTSRKYAQAVLEHFDQQHLTRRVGDARVRGVGAPRSEQ
jgi:selenocysteine-specific elongation factor